MTSSSAALEAELRQLEAELSAETDKARQQRLALMIESRRIELAEIQARR